MKGTEPEKFFKLVLVLVSLTYLQSGAGYGTVCGEMYVIIASNKMN
jgi:hypothetical protein